jgi:hypothetical protein
MIAFIPVSWKDNIPSFTTNRFAACFEIIYQACIEGKLLKTLDKTKVKAYGQKETYSGPGIVPVRL